MKIFHLENMTTQRTPRASAGKVLLTSVIIENKIVGGTAQEQSSPLSEHPMYKILEAYVLERVASQDGASVRAAKASVLTEDAIPSLENPPFAPYLGPATSSPGAQKSPAAANSPVVPKPLAAGGTLRARAVDKTVPRGKR